MRIPSLCGLICLVLVSPGAAIAACPDDAAIAAFVEDFKAARVSDGVGSNLSDADAECARRKVVEALEGEVLGKRIGYKAAFSHPEIMKAMKVSEPSWAVMFDKFMLENGATVPEGFGAETGYEPELVAVVKDAALSDAKTPLEALQHISQVVPYLELVDTLVSDKSANSLIATNIAFRGGVLGTPIDVEPTQAFLDMLGEVTVVEILTKDGEDKEVGRANGAELMGHPVNVAMWMAQRLKRDGVTLKPGDLLDLGGYVGPGPMQPGSTVTVKYLGFPGNPTVVANFE